MEIRSGQLCSAGRCARSGELVGFWSSGSQSIGLGDLKPTEVVRRRLLAAQLKGPGLFSVLLGEFLPDTDDTADMAKAIARLRSGRTVCA